MLRKFFILFFILMSVNANADDNNNEVISVTGEAEVYAIPDEIKVSLTVEVNDKDLAAAQSKNDEITAQVLRLAGRILNIEDKFIQTNYINVRPVYDYPMCGSKRCVQPVFTHFETRKGILITLKDTSLLQKLLEKSLEAGVTRVDGIEFTSSKMDDLNKQARVLAAKNAKQNADEVAAALGVSAGKPKRISVNSSGIIRNYNRSNGGIALMAKSMEAASDNTIEPGQITVSAQVSVDFDID